MAPCDAYTRWLESHYVIVLDMNLSSNHDRVLLPDVVNFV